MESTLRPKMEDIASLVAEARRRIATVVFGQEDTITLLLVALTARGHILMEGVPGVGKTTLAKAFAKVTGLSFARLQLTPDLMPSDITGHTFYDQRSGEFRLRKGPVFTNVLLADEMNRTPPRTQSALLEVMQEHQVTIEGRTAAVPQPFVVIATKNPIEVEGVYPLPEAERDRFMLHVMLRYPPRATEAAMVSAKVNPIPRAIEPVAGLVAALHAGFQHVRIHPDVQGYLLDIVRATRDHPLLEFGASPRGTEHLLQAVRAHALLHGRWFVLPDDVKDLAVPVLRHRIIPSADAEVQATVAEDILADVLDQVAVPLKPDGPG